MVFYHEIKIRNEILKEEKNCRTFILGLSVQQNASLWGMMRQWKAKEWKTMITEYTCLLLLFIYAKLVDV